MKSIIVKNKYCTASFSSGWSHTKNEKGETVEVEQTEEQMDQRIYKSLIEHIRLSRFEQSMKLLIADYYDLEQKDVKMIKIQVDSTIGNSSIEIAGLYHSLKPAPES